jgi:hypothetical protein
LAFREAGRDRGVLTAVSLSDAVVSSDLVEDETFSIVARARAAADAHLNDVRGELLVGAAKALATASVG